MAEEKKLDLEEQETVHIPETPVETMEDYKDALEASFRRIRVGDIMTGRVIEVSETGVLVDFDYYAPGKIALEDLSGDPGFSIFESIHEGEEITATVTRIDDGAGNIVLSRREADDVLAWDKLKTMMKEHTVVHGKISEVVKSGAIMFVEGVRGFIPASKLALSYVEDPSEYLNREVDATVFEVDEETKKLILSCKELLVQEALEVKQEKIRGITVGSVVEGTVEQLKDYGAFVQIGDGISGLLHISQISDRRLKHPKEVLKEGEKITVKIMKVENGKVSLSMKALHDVMEAGDESSGENEYIEEGGASTGLAALLAGLKLN